MENYTVLPKNRFFEVMGGMNSDNHSDNKFTMISELDMTEFEALRLSVQKESGVKPAFTTIVAKSIATALRQFPYANRLAMDWFFFHRLVQLNNIHLSVAVERDRPGNEQAVMTDIIRDVDTLDLPAITRDLQRMAHTTEENSHRWRLVKGIVERLPPLLARFVLRIPKYFPSLWVKYRGGAVLISSPAKYGVDMAVGTWPWPLGFSFGFVKKRPVAINGAVEVRPTMTLMMSFDRRIMVGGPAARFFKAVCDGIENCLPTANIKEGPGILLSKV